MRLFTTTKIGKQFGSEDGALLWGSRGFGIFGQLDWSFNRGGLESLASFFSQTDFLMNATPSRFGLAYLGM